MRSSGLFNNSVWWLDADDAIPGTSCRLLLWVMGTGLLSEALGGRLSRIVKGFRDGEDTAAGQRALGDGSEA